MTRLAVLIALFFVHATHAAAQDLKKEIEKYQKMIADSSPAELFELQGEDLWKKPQGPNKVSLQRCDLGLGAGVLKGAYARLPRYFKDADRVMDLETRLLHCMTALQGRSAAEAAKVVFGTADNPSEMELLSFYVAGQSRGVRMAPGISNAKEKESYELGKRLYSRRAGAWDFSCTSCHGEKDKRIRMQYLPVLSTPAAARVTVATWPAYLVRNSEIKTMQWRMNDCYRQMRYPEPNFASDSTIALILYITVTGNGEPYRGPGIKR